MKEYCAAPPSHRRIIVMTEHDNNVVKRVVAPKPLGTSIKGKIDFLIVLSAAGIVAPSAVGIYGKNRQCGSRSGHPIVAKHHVTHGPATNWRRSVSFTFA